MLLVSHKLIYISYHLSHYFRDICVCTVYILYQYLRK